MCVRARVRACVRRCVCGYSLVGARVLVHRPVFTADDQLPPRLHAAASSCFPAAAARRRIRNRVRNRVQNRFSSNPACPLSSLLLLLLLCYRSGASADATSSSTPSYALSSSSSSSLSSSSSTSTASSSSPEPARNALTVSGALVSVLMVPDEPHLLLTPCWIQ